MAVKIKAIHTIQRSANSRPPKVLPGEIATISDGEWASIKDLGAAELLNGEADAAAAKAEADAAAAKAEADAAAAKDKPLTAAQKKAAAKAEAEAAANESLV